MRVGKALVIGHERTLSPDQEECLTGAGIAVAHTDEVPPADAPYDVILANVPDEYSDSADRLHTLATRVPLIILADDDHLADAYASAVDAAFDCLPRSVNGAWLTHKVHQAMQQHREEYLNVRQPSAPGEPVLGGVKQGATLIGRSAAMERLRREIAEAARANMPVMIHGETGTGKDLVARLLHDASSDERLGAFVKVSCPGLSSEALEEDLFGRVSPDGRPARPGRLELAARGTLLLDEVSEMGAGPQARLLDVLEPESAGEIPSLRLVATSGLTRDQLYSSGRFRRDLYFRLNGYTIQLPPLRDRLEDLPELVEFFQTKYAALGGGNRPRMSPAMLAKLSQYGWPGNIRELEAAVKRFAVNGDEAALVSTFVTTEQPLGVEGQGDRYHESERRVILSALSETRWNRRKAAKLLGISYNTLRRRIQRYQLDVHTGR